MNPLISRVVHDAAAPLEQMLARLLRKFAFVAVAMSCLVAAAAFLTIDLFFYIQTLAGTLAAAGSVAGLFLAAAIILLWLASRPARQFQNATVTPLAAAASADPQNKPLSAPNPEFAARIDAAVAPILDILREGGLEKEALALEAGTAVAKQLNPFSLLGFAIIAGLILGRMLRSKRTLF